MFLLLSYVDYFLTLLVIFISKSVTIKLYCNSNLFFRNPILNYFWIFEEIGKYDITRKRWKLVKLANNYGLSGYLHINKKIQKSQDMLLFRKSDFSVSTLRFRLRNIANKKSIFGLERNNSCKWQN